MKSQLLFFLALSAISVASPVAVAHEGTTALTAAPSGWKVEEGTITIEPLCATCEKPGDIVTKAEYSNFELRIEWKIPSNSNSGVKYLKTKTSPASGKPLRATSSCRSTAIGSGSATSA